MEEHDRDRLRRWRNLPDVSRFMFTDHVIGEAEHARWFTAMLVDPSVRYWVIERDGEPVGLASLTSIDLTHRRCAWGFYLAAPEARGHGLGSVAGHFLIRQAFERLDLRKVCSEVLDFNARALAMYAALGFQEEGRLREHIVKGDRVCDVVVQSLLRREWEARRADIERDLRARGLALVESLD